MKISLNYLRKSFNEACDITSEPIGVSDDQYELLADDSEVKQLQQNSYMTEVEDHPAFQVTNIPTERTAQ